MFQKMQESSIEKENSYIIYIDLEVKQEVRDAKIRKCVPQGYTMSPLILNISTDEGKNEENGLCIKTQRQRMFRFADDTALKD